MTAPRLLVLDVNETLSDMGPITARFTDVGAPAHLAPLWFTSVLRDGLGLAAAGAAAPFAEIATGVARGLLDGVTLDRSVDDAVAHVLDGFGSLAVHPDVPEGLRALAGQGLRIVTLSNGATWVAEGLLERAGVRDTVEAVLSVDDAGVWKPAAAAYRHALDRTGVDAADAMLVAVHPWDLDGAQRAGLRSAWIDRTGAPYPGHLLAPELTERSFVDLAAALDRQK
ncbi:haloacid dehalogenase type II [Rhodococcus aerolatus]